MCLQQYLHFKLQLPRPLLISRQFHVISKFTKLQPAHKMNSMASCNLTLRSNFVSELSIVSIYTSR